MTMFLTLVSALLVAGAAAEQLYHEVEEEAANYDFGSSRQLNLTSAATSSIVFSSVALLLLTLPFLYLTLAGPGLGLGLGGGGSSSYAAYGQASHAAARLWEDQKTDENNSEWFYNIPKIIADVNKLYS